MALLLGDFVQQTSWRCSNLLAVSDSWTELPDSGTHVDTIYLDFAKAFDSVPHQRLLLRLERYGVESHVLAWTRDVGVGRHQRVCVCKWFLLRLGRCDQWCSSG